MARPQKQGIDYFPLDVDFLHDIKVRRVIRACGAESVAVLIATLSLIYSDSGYYIEYSEDTPFLIADGIGIQEEEADAVIQKAVEVGFFDREKFEQFSIITSRGIQSRFMAAAARRSDLKMISEYIVDDVSVNNNSVNVNNNPIIADNNPDQVEFLNTKVHKEKKRKEKKSKEKERDARACAGEEIDSDSTREEVLPDESLPDTKGTATETKKQREQRLRGLFAEFWTVYPRKVAKAAAERAFLKLAPSDDLHAKIIASVKLQTDMIWCGKDEQYIPHAATWLNRKQWEDEIKAGTAPPQPKNRTVIHRARPNAFEDSDQEVEIITRNRANFKDFFG